MKNIVELFDRFCSIKVGVVGDVMLDTYLWGSVDRISPEAPVPIVSLQKKELRMGGAGNVALNLQALGSKPFIISVIGEDEEGNTLKQLFNTNDISTNYTVSSKERLTTNKIRVIGRNQQILRLDSEMTYDLSEDDSRMLLIKFDEFIQKEKPDVVIIEDYNKGVLTERVIKQVIEKCKTGGIITAVDPKQKNFFKYVGVDIFKPNLKEVKEALHLLSVSVDMKGLENIHEQVYQILKHRISLVTLSEKGVFYDDNNRAEIIPSHIRSIADVSGAGDTVISVAALVYAVSKNVHLMAEIANIAGGLVCEEVGTAAIDKVKLLNESVLLLSKSNS